LKTLTAALIIEKNKLANTSPWITLLRVTLADATILKLAAYPSDVTFNSETYTACPCVIEPIGEVASGNIGTLRVAVANVNRLISSYLETNDLLGNAVTVRVVHASHLSSSTDKIDFAYRINRVIVTDEVATFELGHEDLMRLQIPRQRFLRGRCRWVYGDTRCCYPDDEFGATTKQTLRDERASGGPFEKLQGWYVANAHECAALDIGVTADGYLTSTNNTGAVKEWYDSKTDTAFAYRVVNGDIDAETLLVNTAFTAEGLAAHFVLQSSTLAEDWVSICWYLSGETQGATVLVLSTNGETAGTTLVATSTTWYRYARIVRTGNVVTCYGKVAAGDSWTSLGSVTRADIGSPARIGFTSCARLDTTAATAVQWDYLHVTAGGISSCDYTLDGANGCRAHQNALNYGGFPAIPSGRLYGV
jgi:phage-related protein